MSSGGGEVLCCCMLCSDIVPGGIPPRKESLHAFLRLFRNDNLDPHPESLPKFSISDHLLLCSICSNKMEVVLALFSRFDMIRKELSDYRQNFKQALTESPHLLDPFFVEVKDLRSEIINELQLERTSPEKEASQVHERVVNSMSLSSVSMGTIKVEPEEDSYEEDSKEESEFILPGDEEEMDEEVCEDEQPSADRHRPNILSKCLKRKRSVSQISSSSLRSPKPKLTILQFISRAILSQPTHRATIREIYNYMTTHSAYYRNESIQRPTRWQNSVRHTISINSQIFRKVNSEGEDGRGWWAIQETCRDILSEHAFKEKESLTTIRKIHHYST